MLSDTLRILIAKDPRSAAEIGRLAGITAGHLSRYVNHGATLSTDKLDALVAVLRLEIVSRETAIRARLEAARLTKSAGDRSR